LRSFRAKSLRNKYFTGKVFIPQRLGKKLRNLLLGRGSSESSPDMKREAQFVICIGNKGYAASLELRKIYQTRPDKTGSKHGQIRVIDESGEDYLYPERFFVPVKLPQAVEPVVRRASA
jgi:hypothetical protein